MSTIEEIKQKYYNKIDFLDLELIISRVIKKPREFVLAHPEHKIPKLKIKNLKLKIARRVKGEPLAYILGEKEFYGFNFKVNKNVLIPRPETEMIVEEALNHITRNMKHITFIDVGTGSGCIIIMLAKLLSNYKLKIKNYELLGIDISKSALKIARQNAKLHKVDKKIKLFRGNLLDPIIKKIKNKKLEIRNYNLVILANLPYLTSSQIKNSPAIQHDPKIALSAGKDGLKYYRQLFKQIKIFAKFVPNSQIFVICEIDPSQTSEIKKIIYPVKSSRRIAGGISRNAKSFNRVKIKKDLCGLNRLVIAEV